MSPEDDATGDAFDPEAAHQDTKMELEANVEKESGVTSGLEPIWRKNLGRCRINAIMISWRMVAE